MKTLIVLYKKYKEIVNYIIFGLLTTVVNLLVKYTLLFTVFEADDALQLQCSIVISWIVAVIFAYITNSKFVFESTNKNKIQEFINFVISRIVTLILEMFVMWFFITFLQLNSNLEVIIFTIISQAIVILGNYIFSKLFVFKKTDK